jgi:pimeloyl-ACP methyl ester carboxylesterase
VLFIPGQREVGEDGLCPTDITNDHTMWGPVLELSGRCGLVLIAMNVSDVNFTFDVAAQRALDGLAWARDTWDDRKVLEEPPVVVDPTQPTPLPRVGVIGHSWGAQVAARLAVDQQVRCVVGVSGTWDDNESIAAIANAKVPTLLIAATGEGPGGSAALPKAQPFCNLSQPRHQVTLLGIGHWDLGEIGPCDGSRPAQTDGSRVIAAEMVVVFLHRYLYNANTLHPSLLSAPLGGRPPIEPHVTGSGVCAVQSRWQDPFTKSNGETVLGKWPDGVLPWTACPTLAFSATVLQFGQVPTGTTAARVLKIKNPTASAQTVSFAGSSSTFSWKGFTGSLASGEERGMTISFTPPTSAPVSAKLTVTSSALGSPHVITMFGKGTGGFPVPA